MLCSHSISLYPNHVVTNRLSLKTGGILSRHQWWIIASTFPLFRAWSLKKPLAKRQQAAHIRSCKMKSLLLTVIVILCRRNLALLSSSSPGLDTTTCTGVLRFMAAAQCSWWGKVFGGFHIPPFVFHITDVSLNVLRASPGEAEMGLFSSSGFI